MGEKRFTTTYVDQRKGTSAAGDDNVLALIGLASDGPLDDFQIFRGLSGLAAAEALFGTTGRLPRAIREAITTSELRGKPITVHAMRCGEGGAASELVIQDDSTSATVMTLAYDYTGEDGDEWAAKLELDDVTLVLSLRRGSGDTTQIEGLSAAALLAAINDADLGITATAGAGIATAVGDVNLFDWTNLAGGADGTLTNAEVIRALALAESETFLPLIVVGAKNAATRTAIATHCANQLSERACERFALIEFTDFTSAEAINSSAWRTDVSDWADAIVAEIASANLRNLIPFAGQAIFYDADGAEYEAPVLVAAAAAWLGEAISRSLLGLVIPTIVRLVPEIPPEYRDVLADGRINFVRYEEGVGYQIGNDVTLAESVSDFVEAKDLRTAYTCGKEARNAGKADLGAPNDPVTNSGLESTVDRMAKPLERRKSKVPPDISGFRIVPTIDEDTGIVSFAMGITPIGAMREISHTVYLM